MVSEYIFKLVYHWEGSRCAKKLLNRLLLLLAYLKKQLPRCAVEKEFLKISQISQENTCVGVFLIKLQGWRAHNFQLSCLPVNFAKFLRTPIFKNICERLLLHLHVILFTMHEKDTANNVVIRTLLGIYDGHLSTLLKKRLWHRCFPVNFLHLFKETPLGDCFCISTKKFYHRYLTWF